MDITERCTAVFGHTGTITRPRIALGKRGPGAIDGSLLGSERGVIQSPIHRVGWSGDKPSVDIERCTAIPAREVPADGYRTARSTVVTTGCPYCHMVLPEQGYWPSIPKPTVQGRSSDDGAVAPAESGNPKWNRRTARRHDDPAVGAETGGQSGPGGSARGVWKGTAKREPGPTSVVWPPQT